MEPHWQDLAAVDVVAWSELTRAVAEADGSTEVYRPEDLQEELDDLGPGQGGTIALVGTDLAAFGTVRVRAATRDDRARVRFEAAVHPTHRGHGLESELQDRLERRAVELAADVHPGADIELAITVPALAVAQRDLLAARGWDPARWFRELRLDLAAWTPPATPDPRVVAYREADDAQVRAAHTAAFADHWGSLPPDQHEWQSWYTGARAFRPEPSQVVLGADGRVEAYALLYDYHDGEVDVGQLGVRPDRRRDGLGSATLRAALAAARSLGYRVSTLAVDSENAHDAATLYDRVGYRIQHQQVAYVKNVAPGSGPG